MIVAPRPLSVLLSLLAASLGAIAANMPPTVAITGYGMGAYSLSPCAADAADADGWVVKVEFYANNVRIGEGTERPYCYHWTNVPVGVHTIHAVATDNEGATGTSSPITVEVRHPFGAQLLTPTNEQVFVLGEKVQLTAHTTNGQGAISLRYTYNGYNAPFPELREPPFEFSWSPQAAGTYSMSATAVQESWNPSPYAFITPVKIHVIPVRGFPVIVAQPTNQFVAPGVNSVLSVSAVAELPISYQWRFNGTNLPNATNRQLVLRNVSREQAGPYSALVRTATGALVSGVGHLDVLPSSAGAVRFANHVVVDDMVVVDGPFSLHYGSNFIARLYAGPRPDVMELVEPPVTFTESTYFDGGARSIRTVAPGETAYVRIVVRELGDDPHGPYTHSRVLAVQTGGSDAPAPLVGLTFAPPPLTPDPYFGHNRDWLELAAFGTNLTLGIGFQTYAQTVTYQWQKDGLDIPGASGSSTRTRQWYPQYCGASLVLTNVQISDIGRYRLRIHNGTTTFLSPAAVMGLVEPNAGRLVGPTVGNGTFRAQLHGGLGKEFALQFSPNLLDWTTLSTVTNLEGVVPLEAPAHAGVHGFYRALSH